MGRLILAAVVIVLSVTHQVQAQFKNLVIAAQKEGEYPPLEPSIAISRKNPKNIVAGVVLNKAIYTVDGGLSWKTSTLQSPYGVYGDPAVISDVKGDFYYFHLADPSGEGRSNEAWLDRIVMQKSTDGGATWSEGESIGYNPPADQDKEWPAVHPRKQYIYTTWTQFDKYGLTDPNCHSNIMFSMSTNAGKKWSKAIQINQTPGDCVDDDNTAEGAVPAVDAAGRVFVVWSNQGTIFMDRSFDGGTTWLTN